MHVFGVSVLLHAALPPGGLSLNMVVLGWPNFLHGYWLPRRRKQQLPEEGLHLGTPQCHLNGIPLFKGSHQASPDETVLLMGGAACAEENLVVAISKDYVLSLLPTAWLCVQAAGGTKTITAAGKQTSEPTPIPCHL